MVLAEHPVRARLGSLHRKLPEPRGQQARPGQFRRLLAPLAPELAWEPALALAPPGLREPAQLLRPQHPLVQPQRHPWVQASAWEPALALLERLPLAPLDIPHEVDEQQEARSSNLPTERTHPFLGAWPQ